MALILYHIFIVVMVLASVNKLIDVRLDKNYHQPMPKTAVQTNLSNSVIKRQTITVCIDFKTGTVHALTALCFSHEDSGWSVNHFNQAILFTPGNLLRRLKTTIPFLSDVQMPSNCTKLRCTMYKWTVWPAQIKFPSSYYTWECPDHRLPVHIVCISIYRSLKF